MEFRILGPVEALDGEHAITLAGSKQRALLALLALHANEPLTSERLIDELWGEEPPATAGKTLQAHVSRLRKALDTGSGTGGELLVTREHGYELRVHPDSLDSLVFERLVSEGRGELAAERPERAASALETALSLWRGPPLADLDHAGLAQIEIARLGELRAAAQEDLIEAKLALGRHNEVVGPVEALIAEHPYGSGSGRSSCSRCTGGSGRPTRFRPTRTRAGSWWASWASSPASAFASSSRRC